MAAGLASILFDSSGLSGGRPPYGVLRRLANLKEQPGALKSCCEKERKKKKRIVIDNNCEEKRGVKKSKKERNK